MRGGLGVAEVLQYYNLGFTEVFLRLNPLHLVLRGSYKALHPAHDVPMFLADSTADEAGDCGALQRR